MPLQAFCRNCAQYRREWCNIKVDSPDPDMARDCQYYRGQTNGDRIRAMTDEELAGFLQVPHCDRIPNDDCKYKYLANCTDCWFDWLKQEADNG